MAQQNLILCIDIGGDSIKAAEFSYIPGQSLNLERFAYTDSLIGSNRSKRTHANGVFETGSNSSGMYLKV